MDEKIAPEKFREILPLICDKETSGDHEGWKPDNPLWGHCAVIAMLANNLFGGKILNGKINFSDSGGKIFKDISHYWNLLPKEIEVDFSSDQFGKNQPVLPKGRNITKTIVYFRIKKSKRFKLLAFRLAKNLSGDCGIFNDPIYQKCFFAALDSPCQKLRFGCVITHNSKVVYAGQNKTIEPLKSFCEPTCIRLSIQSRTESMIGACGHAEEIGLWETARQKIPLNECELYVAGIDMRGLPLFKKEPGHTCLRCAVQMYNAGVKMIYGPAKDGWLQGISAEKAVKTAKFFATGEQKV